MFTGVAEKNANRPRRWPARAAFRPRGRRGSACSWASWGLGGWGACRSGPSGQTVRKAGAVAKEATAAETGGRRRAPG